MNEVERKYKIIKEYERYYLTEDKNGNKECFDKATHTNIKDGYLIVMERIIDGTNMARPRGKGQDFKINY